MGRYSRAPAGIYAPPVPTPDLGSYTLHWPKAPRARPHLRRRRLSQVGLAVPRCAARREDPSPARPRPAHSWASVKQLARAAGGGVPCPGNCKHPDRAARPHKARTPPTAGGQGHRLRSGGPRLNVSAGHDWPPGMRPWARSQYRTLLPGPRQRQKKKIVIRPRQLATEPSCVGPSGPPLPRGAPGPTRPADRPLPHLAKTQVLPRLGPAGRSFFTPVTAFQFDQVNMTPSAPDAPGPAPPG